MGAILSLSSSDFFSSLIYFLHFANHYLNRQFIKKKISKMKTELKAATTITATNNYHQNNTNSSDDNYWSTGSEPSSPFPYGLENKENSVSGWNSNFNLKNENIHLSNNTPKTITTPSKIINPTDKKMVCGNTHLNFQYRHLPVADISFNSKLNPTNVPLTTKSSPKTQCSKVPPFPTSMTPTSTTVNIAELSALDSKYSSTLKMQDKKEIKSAPCSSPPPDYKKNNYNPNCKDKRNKHRKQQQTPKNGSRSWSSLLRENIEEAVRNFSWNSGYVHQGKNYSPSHPVPYSHPDFSNQGHLCSRNIYLNPYFPAAKPGGPYFQPPHCIATSTTIIRGHHRMKQKNLRANPNTSKKGMPPFGVKSCPTVGFLGPQPAPSFYQFDRTKVAHQGPLCKNPSPWWSGKSSNVSDQVKHQERFKRTHWFSESMKKENCKHSATGAAAAKDMDFHNPQGVDIFDLSPPRYTIIQNKVTTTESIPSSSGLNHPKEESPREKKNGFVFVGCISKEKENEKMASRALPVSLADNHADFSQDHDIYIMENGCSLVSGAFKDGGCSPTFLNCGVPKTEHDFVELDYSRDDVKDDDDDGLILFMSPSLSSARQQELYSVEDTDGEDEEENDDDSEIDTTNTFTDSETDDDDDDDGLIDNPFSPSEEDDDYDSGNDEIDGYYLEKSSSPSTNCFILTSSWSVRPSELNSDDDDVKENALSTDVLNHPVSCSIAVSSSWTIESPDDDDDDDDLKGTVVNREPPKNSSVSVSCWAIKPDDDDADDDVDDWENTWSYDIVDKVQNNNNNNSDDKDKDNNPSPLETIKGGGGSVSKCLEGLNKADGVGCTGASRNRSSSIDRCLQPAITPFLSSSSSSPSSYSCDDDDDYCRYDEEEERRKVEEANLRWNAFYNNDINHDDDDDNWNDDDDDDDDDSNVRRRKVQFPNPDNLASVHLMVEWAKEYQAARIGPWIGLGVERKRFQLRIKRLQWVLDPVLDQEHRKKIMASRFPELATSETSERDSEE